MAGVLRVKPAVVAECGRQLSVAAARIPDAPQVLVAAGDDALSLAALERQRVLEAPLIEGLPATRAAAEAGGAKVSRAARLYADTDERLGAGLRGYTFTATGG